MKGMIKGTAHHPKATLSIQQRREGENTGKANQFELLSWKMKTMNGCWCKELTGKWTKGIREWRTTEWRRRFSGQEQFDGGQVVLCIFEFPNFFSLAPHFFIDRDEETKNVPHLIHTLLGYLLTYLEARTHQLPLRTRHLTSRRIKFTDKDEAASNLLFVGCPVSVCFVRRQVQMIMRQGNFLQASPPTQGMIGLWTIMQTKAINCWLTGR